MIKIFRNVNKKTLIFEKSSLSDFKQRASSQKDEELNEVCFLTKKM